MAYTFEAIGWEDFDGNRHRGTPSDLDATHGVIVEYHDPDNSEDRGAFIAYARGDFEDWAEWWVYIGGLMEMHGLDLAT